MTPSGILAAKLEGLRQRMSDLECLDAGFRTEMGLACELAAGLEPYISSCTTEESSALRLIAQRTEAEDWGHKPNDGPELEQEMLSGHVEGQALKFLVSLSGARRVLDIGMFTGYSAMAMAEPLPADGQVVACEADAYVAGFAQRNFDESPDGHKICVKVGPALDTLEQLSAAEDSFDLVFIDADKGGYGAYLNLLLEADLLAPGGVICVDNTLMQGLPYSSGESTANAVAIAAFNQGVVDDPRVVQVLLPLRDGLTLIRRA